jgi:hypothetical protein
MGKFHFFTDYDLLTAQSSTQAFGAAGMTTVLGVNYDQYRVTSLHTSTGTPRAYAICDGTICAQIDSVDPTLVNIILKPLDQPAINFVPIKYYIYKGIKLNSLVNTITNEISDTSTMQLAISIRDSQAAWNTQYDVAHTNPPGTTIDKASANSLGIHYTALASSPNQVLDSDGIDTLFYRENADFQLPNIQAGWSIGEFSTTQFGIEIVLDNIAYIPEVSLVRKFENYISVSQLPAVPTQAATFEHWHDKEECLIFMDAAAFYGSMFLSSVDITNSSNQTTTVTGDNIYSNLLDSFYNKNVSYIDLRNEFNHALNYYKNLDNQIEICFDGTNFNSINYYNSGWPIVKVINTDLPTGNTTGLNIISIRLPKGDCAEPLLYIIQGYVKTVYEKELATEEKFVEVGDYSSTLLEEIRINLFNNISSGVTQLIAGYFRLKYILKEYDSSVSATSVQFRRSELSFDIMHFQNVNKLTDTIDSYVVNDKYFINHVNYSGQTMICQLVTIYKNEKRMYGFLANEKYLSMDFNILNSYSLPFVNLIEDDINAFVSERLDVDYKYIELTIGGTNISVASYSNANYFNFNDTEKKGNPFDFFSWEFTDAEMSSLVSSATSSFISKYPQILSSQYSDSGEDDNGIFYSKYEIILKSYILNTTTNEIEISSVNTGIYRYTLFQGIGFISGTMIS